MSREVGQDSGQIAAALQHRTGSAHKIDAQLGGHNLRQGGFPKAGVTVKKHMIHSLTTLSGGIKENAQIGP